MSYELIITEKPKAAQKIAEALADKKPVKHRKNNVNYYSLTHGGKHIIVCSAVGHLFSLAEKGGESWDYPVFETEWKPVSATNKEAKYVDDYIKTIKELGKEADEITIATDLDVEGEVIGLNIVRFVLGKKDANRMKFSTLTKPDIVKAYENKQRSLEWGLAKAGETRHHLDWLYGINLSRAFTKAIRRATKQFKVLSTGRVQGPALNFLAEREKKIKAFKPEPFWVIRAKCGVADTSFEAIYKEEKLKDEKKAKGIYEETKEVSIGKVLNVERKRKLQSPPVPFDLTSLQVEASSMLGFTPKKTLEIAQELYIEGYTSYPRTSSQKLPKELNLKKILQDLSKQEEYKSKSEWVLNNTNIKPNEGKKTDPAHPAIYPTGIMPKKLTKDQKKLYDLIVKRFLAVFGKPAVRETNKILISINGCEFVVKGSRTVERNWHELYEPYVKLEEVELPDLKEGDEVSILKVYLDKKETQPPKRYTQSSIIKELEKRGLGTKATRAAILDSLYSRGYIVDKSIKVTDLGLKIIEVLKEELPVIVDESLTREFEEKMKSIQENKATPEEVIEKAKKVLEGVLKDFKEKEYTIGYKLGGASFETDREKSKLGICPVCKKGNLRIIHSKKTNKRFIACDNYPECKTTLPLPQKGTIEKADQICPICGYPMVILIRKGKRPWKFCVNPNCKSRNFETK